MARGVNKVLLLGSVGKDPEVRATSSGSVVSNFSLATSDRVKKNDQWEDETTWHNVVAFGRTAEIVRDYVKKGTQLFIEGKITTRSWDDKDTGQKKYRTEVLVNELSLLGGKSEGGSEAPSKPAPQSKARETAKPATRQTAAPAPRTQPQDDIFGDEGITDDDMPF